MPRTPRPALLDLRTHIRQLEGGERRVARVLPFRVPMIDDRMPGGGLALGAVHEFIEGDSARVGHGAAAALFVAGILARMEGPVLWCLGAPDLYAPALCQVGLNPDRVVYAEAPDDRTLPLLIEEGLRHRGLAAVVGEIADLPMTTSRRLQLAAEQSGVTAIVLHRARRPTPSTTRPVEPSAAVSRWRVSALPSSPLPTPGIGRPRWRVELVRCRGGGLGVWDLEGCDEKGRLGLPTLLGNGSPAHPGPVLQEPTRGAVVRIG